MHVNWRTGRHLALFWLLGAAGGCFTLLPQRGGGLTEWSPPRRVDPADIAVPAGYRIEPVAQGLNLPTAVTMDAQGRVYVTEAGYSYGGVVTTPRLLRVEPNGSTTVIAAGTDPPWNGVTHHDGAFYVAAAGHRDGGRILRIGMDGQMRVLIDSLPSLGDHHTNGPVIGPDGWLYFGQGTATNSGVVGLDNFAFGWVERHPGFHDIPCRDVRVRGRNFVTANPLTPAPDDRARTGPFMPFGTPVPDAGQTVQARMPCSGAILRIRPTGGAPELVAWGFRNPFGLAWSPDGVLYATENSFDVRGSRPVWGTGDVLWRVQPGAWYGWPDFHAGRPLTDADWYEPPDEPAPGFVLAEHPGTPPKPAAVLGVHSSSNGLDFSRGAFGHAGEAFVAQFGDMVPSVGKLLAPVGYKVVRVDPRTGVIHDFAVNRGGRNGPASWLGSGGLERPIDAQFTPDGATLYVVDFGVMTMSDKGSNPRLGTGVLWRITRTGAGS